MKRITLCAAACWAMLATVAGASLILQEGFDTTTSGWESRPTGDFSFFTNSISYGNPAGSIFGDFGSPGVPLPRLDAFRADGYTNIESHPKALSESKLLEAIADSYFVGIRSATQLTARIFENAPRLIGALAATAGNPW